MTQSWINRIGTAVPPHDIHAAFVAFARDTVADWHKRMLFDRMATLADIEHRYAIIEPGPKPRDHILDAERLLPARRFPLHRRAHGAVSSRMRWISRCRRSPRWNRRDGVTHLIVASCTGFTAPGLDFQIMRAAGLRRQHAAHDRRLHGLLRRGQCAEARRPDRPRGPRVQGAGGQPGTLQPASAGAVSGPRRRC